LQADGVQHAGRSFAKAGSRCPFERFARKAFDDQATEAIQVNQVGKLDTITKCAASGKNGIPQAQGANLYAEIDSVCGTHFGKELTTKAA
jgi:hypothetical protein